MKTIVTLFATLFILSCTTSRYVHESVDGNWFVQTSVDRMTDEESKGIAVLNSNSEDIKSQLSYFCETTIMSLKNVPIISLGVLGKIGSKYEIETSSLNNKLLIRFDKEPAYDIYFIFDVLEFDDTRNVTINNVDVDELDFGEFNKYSGLIFTGRRFLDDDSKRSEFIENMQPFLAKMAKHQILLIKIQIQSDDFDKYIIAEFDISGFSEAVENHCG